MGGMAGGAIGSMFGAPVAGSAAGTGLGATISKWLGAGDYSVSQNSLVQSVKASGSIPMMHMNDQTVVIRHKEFVCEVLSNTAFTVNRTLTINPGNSSTFPWLSRLANSYQQYRIRGMVYHYVPTSGSAISGTNNALGSVMMQTSYRSNDRPPTTKVELLNEFWSSESVPSEPFCHPIECNPAENPFNVQYIRGASVAIPNGDSPLLYDLGSTHLAVSGQQASGVTLGDLWVTYEIELKKPIISSNVTNSAMLYGNLQRTSAGFADPFNGVSTNNVGNLPFSTSTARTITLPPEVFGEFWIIVRYKASTSFTNPVVTGIPTTMTNCVQVNWGPFADRYEDNVGAGGTTATATYAIRVQKFQRESLATITFPLLSVTAGSLDRAEITIFGTPEDLA